MTVNKQLSISFPCSLRVYQYHKKVGFPESSLKLIRLAVTKLPLQEENTLSPDITHKLHVPVTPMDLHRYGYYLSNGAVNRINEYIEVIIRDQIRQAFIDELESSRRNQVKFRIKPVIDDILTRLGLSEEAWSFDAAKKDLQRFCLRHKIEYSDEKKFFKSVPKLRSNCLPCIQNGVLLSKYLKYKGIGRAWFYRAHKPHLKTFKCGGRLYIHVDCLPPEDLSFK